MDHSLVPSVLSASSDRQIVGRIRLQKIFYLLEQLGLNSGIEFSYHHYGPYSEDLSNLLLYAECIDETIEEETGITAAGHEFSFFRAKDGFDIRFPDDSKLSLEDVKSAIEKMKKPTSVVIELAATIHWLREKEKVEDWQSALITRKTSKATPDNIAKAELLLSELQL